MATRSIVRAFVLCAAATCAHGATAEPLLNAVPIQVRSHNRPPDGVAFELTSGGQVPFTPHTGYFEGRREVHGAIAMHLVTLSYGDEVMPLRLRTRYDMPPPLQLQIEGPAASGCSQGDVQALEAVTEDAAPAMRLRALVQARHLLVRQANPCSALAKPALARVYYKMSCSLAQDTDYFFPHPEAQTLLNQYSPATAAQMIRDCRRAVFGQQARWYNMRRGEARTSRDFVLARQLSDEMLTLAQDPEWQVGFEAQRLDVDAIRGFQVRDLFDLQAQVGQGNDLTAATLLQEELIDLSAQRDYRQVFVRQGITPNLLQLRRNALQERLNARATESEIQR